ncbi:MAG: MBL fold metallo-hydrolase [Alphaproteobacteria bacterium]|nr:MBL fold metallo-hydrolase [Alphaproteobacteria bacterium]
MAFKIKFWGVRGSVACPTPRHNAFGGNTSCIEVSMGGQRVILDAGTGLRELGHWYLKKNARRATMLMTHTHLDHINGFPFFSPAFHKDRAFTVMAGHLSDKGGIHRIIAGQMSKPTFPVPSEKMGSKLSFEDFRFGDSFSLGKGIKIITKALNHPEGATGYRIEYRGKSVCYVTDTEHVIGKPDENVLGLIEGADLVIYDSTYTDKEFPNRVGWGHSTWQEGVRLCQAANVKTLAIFHHDPDHEDLFMEQLERLARMTWQGAIVAREHMRFNLL